MKFYIKNLTRKEGKTLQLWIENNKKGELNFTDVDCRIDYKKEEDKNEIINYAKEKFNKKILVADLHYNNSGVDIK